MLMQRASSQVSETNTTHSPNLDLKGKGYLVLPRPFETSRVDAIYESVRRVFSNFDSEEVIHRTLYEVSDEDESHLDPRFYEQGKIAIPKMDYKGRLGYKQLMMSLEFSTEFAELFALGKKYQWRKTHGPENIKEAERAFEGVLDLFSTQAMNSIFAPVEHEDESYCGFLLNDSAPHSVCFGYHYELHQDRHENAVVVSVQLSKTATPWKIGRDLDQLDTVVQEQGSMVVMEAYDYEQRMSPWHMPCIGDFSRNAAVVVFSGVYRDRFMGWLAEHASACGYEQQVHES